MCTPPLFTSNYFANHVESLSTFSKNSSINFIRPVLKELCPDAKVITLQSNLYGVQTARILSVILVQRDNNSCSISHEDCFASQKIIGPVSILSNRM
jgi:hypothetical protein